MASAIEEQCLLIFLVSITEVFQQKEVRNQPFPTKSNCSGGNSDKSSGSDLQEDFSRVGEKNFQICIFTNGKVNPKCILLVLCSVLQAFVLAC